MKKHLMMMASLVAAVAFADDGTCVATAAPERRLVWGRPYQMLESGDGCWANVARDLKADGITDVLCCFTVGAYARFPSKVMAPDLEMAKRGETDLVTPMVRALHAEGIKLHAWMAIANMRYAKDDEPTKVRMKAEGRMAIMRDGKTDREFLCREDPRNVEMLRVAAAELIALGVDGIHLDYIRYNHWADCYCEHFKKAYEANGGKNLADWPKGVDGEKGIDPVWIQTRVQAIDHIVQVLRAEVKKHPGVEISAAVFDPPATTAVLLGQDWPRWVKEGWLDFVCPMDYMADPEDFRREILEEMPIAAAAKKTKVYPGLAVGWSGGENNARTLKEELRMARAYLPGGFTIFYWGRDTKGRIDSMLR